MGDELIDHDAAAIRAGREVITWPDVVKAKHLKELGPPEDVEYSARDRHADAIHEACHAVVAYHCRKHFNIDIATIEKGSDDLGMVKSIPPEDQFTSWRSEYRADIYVSLASLAGERMFFEGDSTSGVGGDLESATRVATLMESMYGMGSTVSSVATARQFDTGTPGGGMPLGPDLPLPSVSVYHDEGWSRLGAVQPQLNGALAAALGAAGSAGTAGSVGTAGTRLARLARFWGPAAHPPQLCETCRFPDLSGDNS